MTSPKNARYNWDHRRLRAALLNDAIGRPCPYCGRPMLLGQPLDLAHSVDGARYHGMAHASCNRREAAIRRNAIWRWRRSRR
jgi:hypothetical protein